MNPPKRGAEPQTFSNRRSGIVSNEFATKRPRCPNRWSVGFIQGLVQESFAKGLAYVRIGGEGLGFGV